MIGSTQKHVSNHILKFFDLKFQIYQTLWIFTTLQGDMLSQTVKKFEMLITVTQ